MTNFEKFLIEHGYQKYILNCKTMKYERTDTHTVSTLSNLDHRYFHVSDLPANQNIHEGKPVTEWGEGERKGEIVFGLSEFGKPPTLISPRPKIRINRDGVTLNQTMDDVMNIVLMNFTPERIYDAMYSPNIILTL